MKKELLTQAGYAKQKGFSRQYVNKIIKLGLITLDPSGKIDPIKADRELKRNSDPARKLKNGIEDLSYTEARTLREQYRAMNEKLVFESRAGELFEAEVVMRLWGRHIMDCRSRLLALPTKIAPVAFACKTIQEVQATTEKLVHEALNELKNIDVGSYSEGKKP